MVALAAPGAELSISLVIGIGLLGSVLRITLGEGKRPLTRNLKLPDPRK